MLVEGPSWDPRPPGSDGSTLGDAGQFSFERARITAWHDFELACLSDPMAEFAGALSDPSIFGQAFPTITSGLRPLTNGQVFFGSIFTSADILVNVPTVLQFVALLGLTPQQQLDALTRLVMHELGHVLGLGHNNSNNLQGARANPTSRWIRAPSSSCRSTRWTRPLSSR